MKRSYKSGIILLGPNIDTARSCTNFHGFSIQIVAIALLKGKVRPQQTPEAKNIWPQLTIIVINLVSSSIIMLPYCKSLWQKPISWYPSDNFFSRIFISSSRLSKPKFFSSFGEHRLLAWPSHFLVNNTWIAINIQHRNDKGF